MDPRVIADIVVIEELSGEEEAVTEAETPVTVAPAVGWVATEAAEEPIAATRAPGTEPSTSMDPKASFHQCPCSNYICVL